MCNSSTHWNLFWWELPPFVERRFLDNSTTHLHSDEGEYGIESLEVRGLMLDMMTHSMKLCCARHSNVAGIEEHSYNFSISIDKTRRFDNQEHMLGNLTDMHTIAMPIMLPTAVAAGNPTSMLIRMVDNTGMMYIAKHRDDDEFGNVIFEGFVNIWPLFLALSIFTGYMAFLLWLAHLRQYLRVNKRPSLARNYFEWYWCAFITASTVGYGDRVPRNVVGKVLTMFWALAGLSLMSLFVATMTTMLTEHQSIISTLSSMKNSRVGVLAGSVERRFVVQDGARPVEYETTDALVAAVVKGEVDGIALDHYTFHHLYSTNELRGLDYEIAVTPGITVGFILFGEQQNDLLGCLRLHAFLNELNVDSNLLRTISHRVTGRELKEEASLALQSTAMNILTKRTRWQLVAYGCVWLIIVLCVLCADVVVRYRSWPRQENTNDTERKNGGNDAKNDYNRLKLIQNHDNENENDENNQVDNSLGLPQSEESERVIRSSCLYATDMDMRLSKSATLCDRCHAILS